MTAATLIRQAHRWIAMLFILAVIGASAVAASGQPTQSALYYLPLPPLLVLMASGLYLLVRPYLARPRRG